MNLRGPNLSQYIRCPVCKKKTVHDIPDPDSKWEPVDGIRVYCRWHRCRRCGNDIRTVELPQARLNEMSAELDQLRAAHKDFQRLIAALESKRMVEIEIEEILSNRVEVPSD